MVLSSLNNRSRCPSEFFFQWFYRTGLADTEITKKQKNTLSLLIILCTESEWTLTIFDLSKVQSLGCPHRLIGFHTTIKSYNIAPPLGYLLTSLPTSNISLDFPYSSPVLLCALTKREFQCDTEASRTITKHNERDEGISNLYIAIQIVYRDWRDFSPSLSDWRVPKAV